MGSNEQNNVAEDQVNAGNVNKGLAKMAAELRDLVLYTRRSCGNVDSLVINKMKRIGIKMSYDINEDGEIGEEFSDLIKENETVYYIDGNIIYYIPIEALQ